MSEDLISQLAKARESFEDGSKQADVAAAEIARLIEELVAPAGFTVSIPRMLLGEFSLRLRIRGPEDEPGQSDRTQARGPQE